MNKVVWLVAATLLTLSACKVDEVDSHDQSDYLWRWRIDDSGVTAGFADYPVGEDAFYELSSGWVNLPSPFNGKGFKLSGNNHSDDLFMFVKRKLTGFEKNTRYDVRFRLAIVSNAGKGCVGVGGAPGEGVTLKIGLSEAEPKAIQNGNSWLMNIDKGQQAVGGADAVVIGNLATLESNCEDEPKWVSKFLDNQATRFTVSTNASGELWLLIGSDSGYEATSTFYITDVEVKADKR